jgi:hypothetical protein
LSIGDEIKVEVDVKSHYVVEGNGIRFTQYAFADSTIDLTREGDIIKVIWFSEYPSMSIISDHEFSHDFLEDLEYETPFFLFSRKRIIDKFYEFKEHFPGAAIHYAMKANSEPEVLQTLANTDCCFEVASKYELNMLKEINISITPKIESIQ